MGEDLIHRADPERADERERKRFERRHLSFGFTMDDVGTITAACGGRLSLEIIKTAVNAFGPPLGGDDTRTAAQRRMDQSARSVRPGARPYRLRDHADRPPGARAGLPGGDLRDPLA